MPLIKVCPIEANPIISALCDIDLSPGISALPNKESFLDTLEKEMKVKESYEIGTDEYARHTMEMTPGQPIQNFRKTTDKITSKDIDKFKNEGGIIDKYKKRFKENWKVELDKAVERMKEQL